MHLTLHKNMTNQEIGDVLNFISDILQLKPGNTFRVKAYNQAAESIAHWDKSLAEIYHTQGPEEAAKIFDQIPGVGESIVKKLLDIFATGDSKGIGKYTKNLPEGMFALCQVSGLGARRAIKLCTKFSLTEENAVEKIIEAAQAGKIRDIEGFGEKSEQELIKMLRDHQISGRMPYKKARKIADKIVAQLKKCPQIKKIAILGSLRRENLTIGDIDLGIATSDIVKVQEFIKKLPGVHRVVLSGEGLFRLILDPDSVIASPTRAVASTSQVDIKVSPLDEWGSFIQHFTGSKEHNIKLRKFALLQNLSLSEHGITNTKTGQLKKFANEEDFYSYLGLKLIPPQERIGADEIARYKK